MAHPILVTGTAGRVGGVGRTVTHLLLQQGKAVQAMVRNADQRAQAFINMSQMTLAQMRMTATTPSPQHTLHWLAEQARNWSGLPVVHVRPTVLLEGFFLIFTPDAVGESHQIRLPFGEGKTSPVAAEDVARVVAALLANPPPHLGQISPLTGPQSETMHFNAQESKVTSLMSKDLREFSGKEGLMITVEYETDRFLAG